MVILSPSSLERFGEKNSVMRREVELAIDEKRNIIPVMMERFDFGSPSAREALTGKLESLSSYNGLKLVPEYIFAGMEKLRRFLNVELEAVHQPALSAAVEENTEKRQVKAKEEPVVQEESLTAEEWFERAYSFDESKNYEEAIRCYQKAIELAPDLDGAHNNLGLILHTQLNRYSEAETAFRKAIELNPEVTNAYFNLGNLLSDKQFKQYEEAEAAFRKAIKLSRFIPRPEAYNNLGGQFHNLKRYKEAEAAYRKAIKLNPEDATAYYNLGILLKNTERYDEAEAAFRKAIELNPGDAIAYHNLAALLRLINRDEDAIPILEKLVNLEPDNGTYRSSLMAVLKNAGKKPEAKRQEEAARKLIRNENEYNRACFESLCGNSDQALSLLKTAFEKDQSSKEWAKQDPDFEDIRNDPRFKELVGE